MVKHHTDYRMEQTKEISKKEHWYKHRDACKLCHVWGANFLIGIFNLNPLMFLRNGELCDCEEWVTLCDDCWYRVLGIPNLIVEWLHKRTWSGDMEIEGSPEETREFVREYIRRWPSKKIVYPKYITEVLR